MIRKVEDIFITPHAMKKLRTMIGCGRKVAEKIINNIWLNGFDMAGQIEPEKAVSSQDKKFVIIYGPNKKENGKRFYIKTVLSFDHFLNNSIAVLNRAIGKKSKKRNKKRRKLNR